MQPLLCSCTSPWQRELCPSKPRHPLSHQDGDWPWHFCPSLLTEESRESKLRGGSGTEKVILLPAGVSTWSSERQEKPFSRAAAIYFIRAVPLQRESVRVTQLPLQGIYGFSQAHGEGRPRRQRTPTHQQLQPMPIACHQSLGPVPPLLITGVVAVHSPVSGHKPARRACRDGFSLPWLV